MGTFKPRIANALWDNGLTSIQQDPGIISCVKRGENEENYIEGRKLRDKYKPMIQQKIAECMKFASQLNEEKLHVCNKELKELEDEYEAKRLKIYGK